MCKINRNGSTKNLKWYLGQERIVLFTVWNSTHKYDKLWKGQPSLLVPKWLVLSQERVLSYWLCYVHCTVCSVNCTVYYVYCTVHSVQCACKVSVPRTLLSVAIICTRGGSITCSQCRPRVPGRWCRPIGEIREISQPGVSAMSASALACPASCYWRELWWGRD